MKLWYLTLLLMIGLTNITSGMARERSWSSNNADKDSGKDKSNDDSNSVERSNGNRYEPIDVKPDTAVDPNMCPKNESVRCDPTSPYRTINGTCNNLKHPDWGVATECYLRFQPAFYEGFESARKSVTGDDLPEARVLSVNIFPNQHRPTRKVSFMFTIFGQTIAHDLSLGLNQIPPGPCCAPENKGDPACFTIPVPANDPFYSEFNVTCLKMNRIQACTRCNGTHRQQRNGATAALDHSIVYGTTDAKAILLRANDGTGKLKSNDTKIGELLPTGKDPFDVFCVPQVQPKCFFAGDARVNQHVTLSSLQTIFMREHNRIATELKAMNPDWDEERLFQEARRINIAEFQVITYKEYLPYLLGPSLMKQFDLSLKSGSEGSQYNPKIRLGVWGEWGFACFRLHSMVATQIGALNLKFKNMYSNPDLIRQGHLEQILQGVCRVPSEKYDHWFVPDTTEYLYQPPGGPPYGNDLASTDMQRGREVGLAPYIYLVRFCFDIKISSFADLSPGLMPRQNANLLKRNYESVEDVDLWVGIQMENHLPGAEVGPTAACIIAKQLRATKFGDRFYFEHENEVPSFTPDQRESLKQSSLSRMLCDNTPIEEIQENVMLLQSRDNPKVSCDDIPGIDLSLWQDDN